MEQSLPSSLSAILVASQFALPLAVAFGVWRAAARAKLTQSVRARTATAIILGVAGWFGAALWFGLTEAFTVAADGVPVIQYALVGPIVFWLYAMTRLPSAAAILEAVPQSWLIGVQLYRSLGAIFLVLWATGQLPGAFAIPAGIGDIAIGLSAPIVAWYVARHASGSKAAAWWWNVLGIADLAVAVTFGMLTSPSKVQALAFDAPNTLITAYPLVMIPIFLVPLSDHSARSVVAEAAIGGDVPARIVRGVISLSLSPWGEAGAQRR